MFFPSVVLLKDLIQYKAKYRIYQANTTLDVSSIIIIDINLCMQGILVEVFYATRQKTF